MRAAFLSTAGIAGAIAAVLLAALVWLYTPVVGISAWWLRAALTPLPVLVWLAVMIVLIRRRERRDAALVAGVTAEDAHAADSQGRSAAIRAEQKAVTSELARALQAMKSADGGRAGYLYERPWYVIIGPPGAGKSTAIEQSGLRFPFETRQLDGIGGTRHCKWWIAEQAVLIDTAGRYTTQDSDASVDKAGWENFLALLRRERPRQPLNGVIVAFDMKRLAELEPSTLEQHAHAVRRRIRELEQHLGQQLPVYFVVTKVDLVAGFIEFFDDLEEPPKGRDVESDQRDLDRRRDQVWGTTFPAESDVSGHAERFPVAFATLVRRLAERLYLRLSAERGTVQRSRIATFPAQFASLEGPLNAFVQEAFGGSRLDPAPYLRGVYFASGTQQGTPIDRLTSVIARTFGVDAAQTGDLARQKGRSYFLGRLLRDVVFREARLAARDRAKTRRDRLVQIGAWSAAAIAVAIGAVLAWYAADNEAARRARVAGALDRATNASSGLPLERASASLEELSRVLPYLDAARALPEAARGEGSSLGLSQERKFVQSGNEGYKRALERVLLPRLLARLEGQIATGSQRPELLYQATRVYLMLGRQGPRDAAFIKEWTATDFALAMPSAAAAPQREKLAQHVEALLGQDFMKYPLDGALVDQARRVFSRLPLADRVYARLRASAMQSGEVAPWRPADALGAAGQKLFATRSGRPISELSVPGFFTVQGLQKGLLARLPQALLEASSEGWVLGAEGAAVAASETARLETAVLKLYADDYVRQWQATLDQIVLAPIRGLKQAAESLNVLGAPSSPMRDLLKAVSAQVSAAAIASADAAARPSVPAAVQGAASGAAAAARQAASGVAGAASAVGAPAGSSTSRVAEALGVVGRASPAATVGSIVEAAFRPLIDFSGPRLDEVMVTLNALFEHVSKLSSAPPGAAPPPPPSAGLDPGQRLAAQAKNAPQPVSQWLAVIADAAGTARAGGTRAGVAAAAAQQLAPFCRGVSSRFPFSRASTAPDMPIGDFAKLFAPGGLFDQFFAQNLRNFVDVGQRPWRPVATEGMPAPVSADDVAQFQRAASIRDAFFPGAMPGQADNSLRFELVPVGLSGARAAVINVGGTSTTFAAGAGSGRPVVLQWPSREPIGLNFDPPAPTGQLVFDGPWASLRFVAAGRVAPSATPDRVRLTLQQGDRAADFELRAASIVNPFAVRDAMAEFRCPSLSK